MCNCCGLVDKLSTSDGSAKASDEPIRRTRAFEATHFRTGESDRELFLACGFTPLHLKTFLAAHLRLCFPKSRIGIGTGLYGDLVGNLERLRPSAGLMVCVVIEWPDLDPRLGIRSLGGWLSGDIPDIVESARQQSERLSDLIKQLADKSPIYVSIPTLPLPPIFTTRGGQAHQYECQLWDIASSLATSTFNT